MSIMRSDVLKETGSKVVYSAKNKKGFYGLFLSDGTQKALELPSLFGNDCITPVFSPNGTDILYSEHNGNNFELVQFNLLTNKIKRLTYSDQDNYAPVWAKNGRRIAWCRVPIKEYKFANLAEIFVSEWPSFKERKLTNNSRMDSYPVFSQCGNYIITESGKVDELFGLFMVDWAAREIPLVYDPQHYGNGIPDVYKDYVVYEKCSKNNPGFFNICVINKNQPEQIIIETEWQTPCNPSPRFSPHGDKIACHRKNNGGTQIVILSFKNKLKEELVIGSDQSQLYLPRWNRDGRCIAVEDRRKQRIIIFDLHGNSRKLIRRYRGQRFMEIYNFDIF
ncbi:MAG: hypothetical protein NUV48_10680 [Peptococcaceae bacterium]|nr:hypothetical protein [Peptococcaceae bacterium]